MNWTRQNTRRGKVVVTAIDAHAAGEPLRIVTSGLPELPGETMLERRRYMRDHFDHLRRAIIHEPRGHFDMYGCVLTPPVSDEADLGVLFLHNAGYSTMCGHGVIALVTALLETGAIENQSPQTPVVFDTPAGLVRATAHSNSNGRVERVSFMNVPGFVYRRDLQIDIAGVGSFHVDIAFGGAFYAVLPSERVGLQVDLANKRDLIDVAAAIKQAAGQSLKIQHPLDDDLGFLYGVIFTDRPQDPAHHSRNLCVFADSQVDRSPTGTGVSARLALHFERGDIDLNETIAIESILGRDSVFEGRIVASTTVGPFAAIVPEVSGRAFITGRHEFVVDEDDCLGGGFLL